MATLVQVAVNGVVRAVDLNQLILALTGGGSYAINIDAVNDASNYALVVKNQGSGGKGLYVKNSSGNGILDAKDAGVLADVLGNGSLSTLVGLQTAQTITSKTFSGTTKFTGLIRSGQAASVTSGATLTIPDAPTGNQIPITGGTIATSITTLTFTTAADIAAGTRISLKFDGNNGIVKDTGNIKVTSWFVAQANAILTLEYDGTNWREVGRAGDANPHSRFYIASGSPAVNDATDTTVGFDTQDTTWSGLAGMFSVSAGVITPLVAGLYQITGVISITNSDKSGKRYVWLDKATSRVQDLAAVGVSDQTTDDTAIPLALGLVRANGSTDTFRVRIHQNSGSNLALQTGALATFIDVRRISA